MKHQLEGLLVNVLLHSEWKRQERGSQFDMKIWEETTMWWHDWNDSLV